MKNRFLAVFMIFAVILCGFAVTVYSEDTPLVVISDIEMKDDFPGAGNVCVIGYIDNAEENSAATILMMTKDGAAESIISGDEIVYIDQVTVGNNGTFLFDFAYKEKFAGEEVVLRIGGTGVENPYNTELTLPHFNLSVENLPDNTVIYGADAYKMTNNGAVTTENVRESILAGGNKVYFKLGGKWYDLLDENATSSAYLVPENAETDAVIEGLDMRYYYYSAETRREF